MTNPLVETELAKYRDFVALRAEHPPNTAAIAPRRGVLATRAANQSLAPEDGPIRGLIQYRVVLSLAGRHRPDRIMVDGVRGGEAFDLLQALNTGDVHRDAIDSPRQRFASCGEAKMARGVLITSDDVTRPSVRSVRPNSIAANTRRAWSLWKTAKNAVPTGFTPVVSVSERRQDHDDRSTQRHHPLNRTGRGTFRCQMWGTAPAARSLDSVEGVGGLGRCSPVLIRHTREG